MGLKGRDFVLNFWTVPKDNIVITQPFLFSNKVLDPLRAKYIHKTTEFSFVVNAKSAKLKPNFATL